MLRVKCGGVSVKGHRAVNQDSFAARVFEWGAVAVVADGLGSCRFSQMGSDAVCDIVADITEKSGGLFEINTLLAEIHRLWLEKMAALMRQASMENAEICDFYTTCLFCVKTKDEVIAVRLGDGFICVVNEDSETVLYDEKEDSFANLTHCLCEDFQPGLWQIEKTNGLNFRGVVLATDGLLIGEGSPEDMAGFSREFCDGYRNDDDIENHIFTWLADWPGGDDKTISFIIA